MIQSQKKFLWNFLSKSIPSLGLRVPYNAYWKPLHTTICWGELWWITCKNVTFWIPPNHDFMNIFSNQSPLQPLKKRPLLLPTLLVIILAREQRISIKYQPPTPNFVHIYSNELSSHYLSFQNPTLLSLLTKLLPLIPISLLQPHFIFVPPLKHQSPSLPHILSQNRLLPRSLILSISNIFNI